MIASGAGRHEVRHLVGREGLDDGLGHLGNLEPGEGIRPDVLLGLDPVPEHAQGPSSGRDGGRLAAALDEVSEPGSTGIQVEVGQGEVALVRAGEGPVRVQPLEVELDRPLRQDLGAAGGDEGGDDRVETVAARVAARRTRRQVNMTIRRIR